VRHLRHEGDSSAHPATLLQDGGGKNTARKCAGKEESA